MKHFNLHSIVNSMAIIGLVLVCLLYFFNDKTSMAYVDNVQLFNNFNMVKDIKAIEEKKINDRSKKLDSIYKLLQLEKNQKSNQAKRLVMKINKGREELQIIKDNYKNNLSQNVWRRLNSYITEYAKENDVGIVFGTSGNGNVMYAEESIEITDEIIEYSNLKYEGN